MILPKHLYWGTLDCGHPFRKWMTDRRAQVGMSMICYCCPETPVAGHNDTPHISTISEIAKENTEECTP
jgi:hypothetical protein